MICGRLGAILHSIFSHQICSYFYNFFFFFCCCWGVLKTKTVHWRACFELTSLAVLRLFYKYTYLLSVLHVIVTELSFFSDCWDKGSVLENHFVSYVVMVHSQ